MNDQADPFLPVPDCLLEFTTDRRWVGWKWENRKDKAGNDKRTKPPFRAAGGYALNDKPETWSTASEIARAAKAQRFEGMGLELLGLKGFAAIDLDNVRDPKTGAILPWAEEAAQWGSYAELTPSGTGLRVLGRVPPDHPGFHKGKTKHPGGEVELYVNTPTGRYVTVSGNRVEGAPDELAPITNLVDKILSDLTSEAGTSRLEVGGTRPKASNSSDFSRLPEWLRTTIEHGRTGDRSADFQSAVNGLVSRVDFGTALRFCREHPNGPAGKYGDRLEGELRRSWEKAHVSSGRPADVKETQPGGARASVAPMDLWGRFTPPELPRGLLPKVIEDLALTHGETMGADPGGLAAAALCVCAAAIPDRVRIKVKRHDDWTESPRLWVALVGDPSTKKSPILGAAERPLRRIDAELFRAYVAAKETYDGLTKDERAGVERPRQLRRRLEDTTIEAAQEVLADSPDGVLVVQDELSGWFGAMDRYSNGKGRDRAFWLQAFNGGSYSFNRVGRGAGIVPNLSVCVLGGIQPEPMRKIIADAADDGLIQRLLPIVLRPAVLGSEDEAPGNAVKAYHSAVEALTRAEIGRVGSRFGNRADPVLTFDDGAQTIRRDLEKRHLDLMAVEVMNRKLAAHVGKYDGIFARLCVVFHVIEHGGGMIPRTISEETARRAAGFLHSFFLPHALAFYGGLLNLSDDHDRLTAVAGFILTHGLQAVNARDVARGDGTMRKLTRADTVRIFEQLEALGWVEAQPTPARSNATPSWNVNPEVHRRFAERKEAEAARRQKGREAILEALKWKS